MNMEVDRKDDADLVLGKVVFTEAGRQLSTLIKVDPIPEFLSYLRKHWGVTEKEEGTK